MKNFYKRLPPDFQLGDDIPDELRLKIYKKLLEMFLKAKDYHNVIAGCSGLCLSLPCLLFNLSCVYNNDPNGNNWDYNLTGESFIELTNKELKIIMSSGNNKIEIKHETRIKFLKRAIKKVEILIKNK